MAAPILTESTVVLAPVDEDDGSPFGAVGTLISALVNGGNVSDSDAGALGGIAVIGTDSSHGRWWYSTNDGASWSLLGAVSDSSARLLAADAYTRVYFEGAQDY